MQAQLSKTRNCGGFFQKQADADGVQRKQSAKSAVDKEEEFSTSTEKEEGCNTAEDQSVSTSEPEASESSEEVCKDAQARKRDYSQRIGSKQPSVHIGKVLRGAEQGMRVCFAAAIFLLGVGKSRLQRVPLT